MKALQWIWAVIVVLAGAGLGNAWVHGASHRAADQAPEGWSRTAEQVPFRRADLMGDLAPSTQGISLDHFMALRAHTPSQSWELELVLGAGSEVRVLLAGKMGLPRPGAGHASAGISLRGDGILLRRSRGGSVSGQHFSSGSPRALSCQGQLPVPGDAPYALRIESTPHGFRATAAGATLECQQNEPQARDSKNHGTPVLMSGLHRVQIRSSQTDSTHFSGVRGPHWLLGPLLGGFLGLLLWWAERKKGADYRICALTSLPFLVAIPLQSADGLALIEQLRMPSLSPYFYALWIPLFLGLPGKLAHHLGRCARAQSGWKRGLLFSTLGGGGIAAIISVMCQPRWPLAIGYFALAGFAFGAIVGLNALAKSMRFVNTLSLGLVLLGLFAGEWGVRFTATGVTWSPTGRMQFDEQLGWTRSTLSDFEALEKQENTRYPREGYPVTIAGPTSAQRIVCLGSSATGGAFQNDDLDQFYPARLQELLGQKAQVLNQGVGGWTSFHIAKYTESKAEALQPDILTLYIGHNDMLTKSSAPYKTLFGAWKSGKSLESPLPNWRLFQGFRFALSALARPEGAVAVPVDHALENIERIHSIAQQRGAKLLLMPEAITPDSAALSDYDRMLRELAARHTDIAYLDIPSLLLDTPGDFFLDDVHLSDAGHRRLAKALAKTLQEQGWWVP
jgi:lysophospholipase L1-like esterase